MTGSEGAHNDNPSPTMKLKPKAATHGKTPRWAYAFTNVVRGFSLLLGDTGTTLKGRTTSMTAHHVIRSHTSPEAIWAAVGMHHPVVRGFSLVLGHTGTTLKGRTTCLGLPHRSLP